MRYITWQYVNFVSIFSETLQNRATLITDTDSLRQQNSELRMLLHQYVNSKVNTAIVVYETL